MRMSVLEKIERLRMGHYAQYTLPTEMLIDGSDRVPPTHFTIFRMTRSDLYLHPFARDAEREPLVTYEVLRDLHTEKDIYFPGCGHFTEAHDIEVWRDQGDEGHTDWFHRGNYRILFHPECGEETYKWLIEASGSDLQELTSNAVSRWEVRNEARNRQTP